MPSRNAPCPCGSGKKWKKCCGSAVTAAAQPHLGPATAHRQPVAPAAKVDRTPMVTLTGEPVQPARIYFAVTSPAAVLTVFRSLKCVQEDPTQNRWVWLLQEEARSLSFSRQYGEIPWHLRPVVLGSFRFPATGGLVLHVPSFDRALRGVTFFAPHFVDAAVPVRARVLNRWPDASEITSPQATDALLDRDVVVIDPITHEKEMTEIVRQNQGSGAEAMARAYLDRARLRDIPTVEDFPLHPEEEDGQFTALRATLMLRTIRAQRHFAGETQVTLAQIIGEVVEGMRLPER